MKVNIIKPWICRGHVLQPGEKVELPEADARRAVDAGVARPVRRAISRQRAAGKQG